MDECGPLQLFEPIPRMPVGPAPITLASVLGYTEGDGLDLQIEVVGPPTDAVFGMLARTGDCTFVGTTFGFTTRDHGAPGPVIRRACCGGTAVSPRARLENQRIDNTADPCWGAIAEDVISRWQEFILGTGAIKSRRGANEYFRGI